MAAKANRKVPMNITTISRWSTQIGMPASSECSTPSSNQPLNLSSKSASFSKNRRIWKAAKILKYTVVSLLHRSHMYMNIYWKIKAFLSNDAMNAKISLSLENYWCRLWNSCALINNISSKLLDAYAMIKRNACVEPPQKRCYILIVKDTNILNRCNLFWF